MVSDGGHSAVDCSVINSSDSSMQMAAGDGGFRDSKFIASSKP